MNEQPEFEELEHIPWSALAARPAHPIIRPATIAIAVVLVVVAIGLAMRAATSRQPDPVASSPLVDAAVPETERIFDRSEISEPTVPSTTVVMAADPGIYSEADLMAISIDDEARLAAVRAEWFVQDYFTVDGDAEIAASLSESAASEEALPHVAPTGSSYVEWARALAVTSSSPSRYVVDVAFRTVSSPEGQLFTRAPVRAVALTVSIDVGGATSIEGLPSPIPLPAMAWAASSPGVESAAPDDVIVAAREAVAVFGTDAVLVEARRDGPNWRFVLEVLDQSGIRWPVAVSIAD